MDPITLSVVGGLATIEFARLVLVRVRKKRRDPLKDLERTGRKAERELEKVMRRYRKKISGSRKR